MKNLINTGNKLAWQLCGKNIISLRTQGPRDFCTLHGHKSFFLEFSHDRNDYKCLKYTIVTVKEL